VCNADLLEKKAFLEARCGLAEARLADLVEEHRLGVAERDCSIAALERREAGGRLVVDAMLLDDIQARPTLPLPPTHPISFPPTPTHQPLTCSIHVGATYSCWIGLIRADALGPKEAWGHLSLSGSSIGWCISSKQGLASPLDLFQTVHPCYCCLAC
jgi:hypothetical protein